MCIYTKRQKCAEQHSYHGWQATIGLIVFFKTSTCDAPKKQATDRLVDHEIVEPEVKKQKSQGQRKFQESWKSIFSWLVYDPVGNVMSCKFCAEYSTACQNNDGFASLVSPV